jgi:Ca2+-binding EF-hand superfamily protein
MGVCQSVVVLFEVSEMDGEDIIAQAAFDKMKLKPEELDKLFAAYRKMDCNKAGYITPKELREFFRAEDNRYNSKLLIDYHGTGKINFFEFVAIVSNY